MCVYLFEYEYLKDIYRLMLYTMGCTRKSQEIKNLWIGLILWLGSTMLGFFLSINCFVQYTFLQVVLKRFHSFERGLRDMVARKKPRREGTARKFGSILHLSLLRRR
jgi:hypothetical protein